MEWFPPFVKGGIGGFIFFFLNPPPCPISMKLSPSILTAKTHFVNKKDGFCLSALQLNHRTDIYSLSGSASKRNSQEVRVT